jgi:hypothetical protein
VYADQSHLIATISNNNIREILSGRAVRASINLKSHLLAVANTDKLFQNAIEPWKFELNPQKHNENIQDIRRLYAPLEYDNRIVPVKFTVKEMLNPIEGKRIYSIETINVEIK